jgi:hypothetical protein
MAWWTLKKYGDIGFLSLLARFRDKQNIFHIITVIFHLWKKNVFPAIKLWEKRLHSRLFFNFSNDFNSLIAK